MHWKQSLRVILVASIFILSYAISALLVSCGGDDEINNWIVPEDISGEWTAFFNGERTYGNVPPLKEYRFTIEENEGEVTGYFEEFYYSGEYFIHPVDGRFNSTTGYLFLSHDSHIYSYFTEIFRFTSETKMHAISDYNDNLPRYECNKWVLLSP